MSIAEKILKPSVAGLFYPAQADELKSMLDSLFLKAKEEQSTRISSIYKAMVIPHAGYRYSGLTAAHAYKFFQPARFKKVIVLGPAHKKSLEGLAVYPQNGYETPFGISPRQDIPKSTGIIFSKDPFEGEHSVEAHLPFIQYRLLENKISLDDYPVTLMVYGNISPKKLAKKIEHIYDDETFLVLSSDLSHFHDIETANKKDEESIEAILSHNPDNVLKAEACGRNGISAFLYTQQSRLLEPEFIHYSNSASVSGDDSRVVGYSSIGYKDSISKARSVSDVIQLYVKSDRNQSLNEDCKKELLKATRFCIKGYLKTKNIPDFSQLVHKYPFLNEDGATFVTLTSNGNLRGCIGNLISNRPLLQDLMTNAVKAACEDPRFRPVNIVELNDLKIEISILNPPQFLRCKSEFDLLNKIQPNEHGLIVQQGNKRATFLPQVWEKIPKKTDFLSQLCKKAGLKPDAWRIPRERIQLFTYTVTSFEEE
ncbi:MAG: AmmeMemoRadiSam system protein B [Candidatus Caenarcaniphilales bacterium]|nr:AmmeMemoRadiSam system protein B [Candidatus Caenarcaniphilales bacterium]